MNQPIDVALKQVRHTIPPQILNLAFIAVKAGQSLPPLNWEAGVIKDVIHDRVLTDCNIVGGRFKTFALLAAYLEETPASVHDSYVGFTSYSLYRIPAELTDNLPINEILSIAPPVQLVSGMGTLNFGAYNTPAMMARAMLSSHTMNEYIQTPLAELLPGNLIRLTPAHHSVFEWVVSVRVGYDNQFVGMNSSAIIPFADMVVEATKAYIYTQLIVALDQGLISHGYELGVVKSIIESFADANTRYMELRDKFAGGATMEPGRLGVLLAHIL